LSIFSVLLFLILLPLSLSFFPLGIGRLPFTFNMTANASYGYVPAYQRFKDSIRIVHFIGAHKPWHGMPHPSPGNRQPKKETLHAFLTLFFFSFLELSGRHECCGGTGGGVVEVPR
jgi:hypothetical protein